MKKILYLFILAITIGAFITGCTIPGAYMSTNDVLMGAEHKTNQPNIRIIRLNDPRDYAGLLQYFTTPNEYKVGIYDVLGIEVYDHPELSPSFDPTNSALIQPGQANNQYLQQGSSVQQGSGYYVNTEGNILFPILSDIHVAGLTVEQIRAKLTDRLSKYIRYPIVSVKILTFNSQRINVLGEVMIPGVRPIGDRPLSVLDAISLAGGINQATADMRHIFVIRGKGERTILVYVLNAKIPSSLLLGERFQLLDNDIVYVAPAGVTDVNRFLGQVLPTIQTFWYTKSLIQQGF